MEQKYSVQQIKFELLSYLKEFGSNGPDWTIQLATGTDDQAVTALDEDKSGAIIWICKPTISERAAVIIRDHMVSRFRVNNAADESVPSVGQAERNWILMYRKAENDVAA